MEELRLRLAVLSAEERSDALQFYEEYFEDAGPENEQAVIAELGSPATVAERILSGEGKATVWRNGRESYNSQNTAGPGNDPQDFRGYRDYTYRNAQQNTGSYNAYSPPKKSNGWMILAIVLLVISSPVWLTVLAVALVALLGVLLAVAGVLLSVICMIVALIFVTIVSLGVGLWMLPRDMLNGLFVLSIGLIGMGGALILVPLGSICIHKGFPALGRGFACCWHGIGSWCGKVWSHLTGRKGGGEG